MVTHEDDEMFENKGGGASSKLYIEKIKDALVREKGWRMDVQQTLKRYRLRGETSGQSMGKGRFNILWSNTEVLRQAIYQQTPRPDVRQRWEQRDQIALDVAELIDRGLTYQLDLPEFTPFASRAVLDYLLCGRAVMRVRYDPTITDEGGVEQVQDERLRFENVAWDEFIHSPAKTWERVEWIAFKHIVDREQVKALFPHFDCCKLDYSGQSAENQEEVTLDSSTYSPEVVKKKTTVLWEVWDKRNGNVVWVSEELPEVIQETPPPLALEGFFPIARPLLAIEDPDSLVPQPLYMQYKEQAQELDTVSERIHSMVKAIKWRGMYDATLGIDIARLMSEGEDGSLVPTDNGAQYLERGGLQNAIFLMPIGEAIATVKQLYEERELTKQTIYEITGISDVLRGVTNANETATAQQLKANWGGARVNMLAKRLQLAFAEICRMGAEIMCEYFQRSTWEAMTSKSFPTNADKQQAQMMLQQGQQMMQQAQAMQQQPPQDLQQAMQQAQMTLDTPSWEDIEVVIKSDQLRSYRVDIETDSTIVANQQAEMQEMSESINALGNLIKALGEGVSGGIMTGNGAKRLIEVVVRKLPMQNKMLPIIEEETEDPAQKQIQQLQQQMNEMQQQLNSKQEEMQLRQAELQMEGQRAQAETQVDMAEIELKRQELAQRPQLEAMKAQAQSVRGEQW